MNLLLSPQSPLLWLEYKVKPICVVTQVNY